MGLFWFINPLKKRGVELTLTRKRGTTKYPQTEIREAHPIGERSAYVLGLLVKFGRFLLQES